MRSDVMPILQCFRAGHPSPDRENLKSRTTLSHFKTLE